MRTENDTCLICEKNKSDKKNSHFIPAGLLKSNVGNRDYENVFSIGLTPSDPLESYKGRSNLENTCTEIMQNPHSAD